MKAFRMLPFGVKAAMLLLAAMYALFLLLDFAVLSFMHSSVVKFCAIVVCFGVACVWGGSNGDKADRALLRSALLLTVCADACLLLLDLYMAGVLIFCFVQTLHGIRCARGDGQKTLLTLALALGVAGIARAFVPFDALFLLAGVYAVMLVLAVLRAIAWARRSEGSAKPMYVMLGMVLFLCCDVFVMLFNVAGAGIFAVLSWVFYLPSQALLALSGVMRESRKQ